MFCIIISNRQQLCAVLSRKTVFHKAFSNLSAFSLDHLSVSSRHTRASNENKFMSLPVRTDVFKYSFFPRTITDWNFLPLAVRLLQSTQSFHGALLNSASSNRWPGIVTYWKRYSGDQRGLSKGFTGRHPVWPRCCMISVGEIWVIVGETSDWLYCTRSSLACGRWSWPDWLSGCGQQNQGESSV